MRWSCCLWRKMCSGMLICHHTSSYPHLCLANSCSGHDNSPSQNWQHAFSSIFCMSSPNIVAAYLIAEEGLDHGPDSFGIMHAAFPTTTSNNNMLREHVSDHHWPISERRPRGPSMWYFGSRSSRFLETFIYICCALPAKLYLTSYHPVRLFKHAMRPELQNCIRSLADRRRLNDKITQAIYL